MDDVQRGQRLRELREAAGLLQRQVGAEFDIDKQAVSSWEKGKSRPSTEKLARLDDMYAAGGEILRLFGVETDLSRRLGDLEHQVDQMNMTTATKWEVVDIEHAWTVEVTQLRDELGRLRETVRRLGQVVREELHVELETLGDVEPPSTPSEPGDGAAFR